MVSFLFSSFLQPFFERCYLLSERAPCDSMGFPKLIVSIHRETFDIPSVLLTEEPHRV